MRDSLTRTTGLRGGGQHREGAEQLICATMMQRGTDD
jgi:hypothetical protein